MYVFHDRTCVILCVAYVVPSLRTVWFYRFDGIERGGSAICDRKLADEKYQTKNSAKCVARAGHFVYLPP